MFAHRCGILRRQSLGTPTYNIRILYVGQSHVPRVLYVGRMHIYPSPTWFWKHGYAHNIRILYVGKPTYILRIFAHLTSHVYYTWDMGHPLQIPPYPRNLYVFYTYILRGFAHVGRYTYFGGFSHLQRGFGNTVMRIIYVYYTWDKNIRIIYVFLPTYFIRIFYVFFPT